MPAKTDRRLVFKRAFVLLRLPVLALLLLVPGVTKALTGTVLALIPYPHSAAKMALECWHVVLLRQELLPALLIGGAVTGLGLTLLPGKARLGACALALALALFLLPWGSAPALLPAISSSSSFTQPVSTLRAPPACSSAKSCEAAVES